MKPHPSFTAEALEKIDEIRRYYEACETMPGSALRMSKTMLSFVLGVEDRAAIDEVLEALRQQGQLAAVFEEEVVFSPLSATCAC